MINSKIFQDVWNFDDKAITFVLNQIHNISIGIGTIPKDDNLNTSFKDVLMDGKGSVTDQRNSIP